MNHRTLLRRGADLALAGFLLLGTAITPLAAHAHFSDPDSATTPGKHHWAWTPQPTGSHAALHVKYSRGCSGPFYDNVGKAGGNWQATQTPLYFDEVAAPSSCSGSPRLGIVDVVTSTSLPSTTKADSMTYVYYPAVYSTYKKCDGLDDNGKPTDCHYVTVLVQAARFEASPYNGRIDASVIRENTALLDPRFPFPPDAGLVATTHEFGHSLGLQHNGCYIGETTCGYSIMDDWFHATTNVTAHDIADINKLYPGW